MQHPMHTAFACMLIRNGAIQWSKHSAGRELARYCLPSFAPFLLLPRSAPARRCPAPRGDKTQSQGRGTCFRLLLFLVGFGHVRLHNEVGLELVYVEILQKGGGSPLPGSKYLIE